MDLDTENKLTICRLCLQTSDDVVNIWSTFQDSTIASVVSKHFWFEINKCDVLTEWLCQTCWMHTKMFHEFYKQIELFQKRFHDSTERNDRTNKSGKDVNIDTDHSEPVLNIVKCEVTELKLEATDISSHDSSEDDSTGDEDETGNILENDEECTNNEQKDDSQVKRRTGGLSSSEKIELDGQIRAMFNMKCEICSDVEFTTLLKVQRHYRKVHHTKGYLTCCGKKLTSRYEIVNHIRYHINPDAHCSDELESRIREFFHMKCEICSDVEFETLSEVRQHYRKVHNIQGYITCCGKKYIDRNRIVKHVRHHINPDAYHCDQCNKSFCDEKALKSHIENHVPLDSRKFKCDLCRSSFTKEYPLKVHVRLKHTSKTGEDFPCDKCGKNFRSSYLLTSHIRQSHLSREYVCEVCARTFKNKHNLERHVKNEHASTPSPKVQCDVCGVWVKHINLHRKLHEETTPLNCSICNKEIRSERLLRKHVSFVHGKKSHQCSLCDKVFKRASMLKEHFAIHTGEDLYNCPYCDKKFKSNANMYKHRKTVHSEKWTRDRDLPQCTTSTKVSAEANT